uniref:Malonyl CoA-acyl carrier protein transacylase n=1 Tax=candidate division WOR-3 bacterium TaxID=2052148 RepID=A0A7C3J5X0_UNCW3
MKSVLMFPGQGSQYVKMGFDLYQHSIVKKLFDKTSEIIKDDISKIMFEGPENILTESKNAQVAILLHSYSVYSLIKDKIKFDAVCGHSLGEYSALLVADVFDFETAIKLVRKRGELMSLAGQNAKGSMAAVIGLSAEKIESIVSTVEGVVVANYNGEAQTVISGTEEGVEKASQKLNEEGAKRVIKLNVSGAFHSPLMNYAWKEFSDFIESFQFKKPKCYILMNVSADFEDDPERIKNLLKEQIVSPVRWTHILKNLSKSGYENFYEIGPSKVLSGIARKMLPDKKVFSFEKDEEIKNFFKE